MIDKGPGLRAILHINLRFIGTGLVLFYAWVCWQWTSPEWWGFGLIAILTGLGGASLMIGAISEVAAIVKRNSVVGRFTREGGKARADRMAGERDLKDHGMIR